MYICIYIFFFFYLYTWTIYDIVSYHQLRRLINNKLRTVEDFLLLCAKVVKYSATARFN